MTIDQQIRFVRLKKTASEELFLLKKPLNLKTVRHLLNMTQKKMINGEAELTSSSSVGQCTSAIKYWHDESDRLTPKARGKLLVQSDISRLMLKHRLASQNMGVDTQFKVQSSDLITTLIIPCFLYIIAQQCRGIENNTDAAQGPLIYTPVWPASLSRSQARSWPRWAVRSLGESIWRRSRCTRLDLLRLLVGTYLDNFDPYASRVIINK